MSNSVMVSPLPEGTSIAKVREIFSPFITDKIIVQGNKAYIKFTEANDIDSLYMKYDDGIITDLGNAQVVPIPEDFNWSLLEKQDQSKDTKVADFVLQAPSSVKKEEKATSRFIVVSNCDEKTLNSYS